MPKWIETEIECGKAELMELPEPLGSQFVACLVQEERLAVNFRDLDRIDDDIRLMALSGSLNRKPLKMKDGEVGVEFNCDPLLAAELCDTIRTNDRIAGQEVTRVYLFDGETWVKVSAKAFLTVTINETRTLNPDVFASAERRGVQVVPLPTYKG